MFVGVLRVSLSIVSSRSLKDKRRVVMSLKERISNRFKVSVAEVGELGDPRRAHLGIACVSNEAAHCDRVLADVAHAASTAKDALLTDRATEIIPFGDGGRGITGGIEDGLGLPIDDDEENEEPWPNPK